MQSRRILITGLSSHWGGRLAQMLEREPAVEAIIGVDTGDPRHQLDRTEFVRVDAEHARLRRIIGAAAVDTVVDTRLVNDPLGSGVREAHDINVVGTSNILASCTGPDSPVRKLVFKSSAEAYGCSSRDPAFFTEEIRARAAPGTAIERDIADAERAVAEFAARNPETTVTVLRFADSVGPEIRSSFLALLNLSVVPGVFGFDPRWQLIHEDDVVGVLEHAVRNELAGTLQRRRGRGARALRDRVAARQAATPDPAAVGYDASRPRSSAGSGCEPRLSFCERSSTAAASTTGG